MRIPDAEYYNSENKLETQYNGYLSKIGEDLGTWGSNDDPPKNIDEIHQVFGFEPEQRYLYELIKFFAISEFNNKETMVDMEHRHGLQAMYVMRTLLKSNPNIIDNQDELLVAALLHDYMAVKSVSETSAHSTEEDVNKLLNRIDLPVNFNRETVFQYIKYTDYPNNEEVGLHNKDRKKRPFLYSHTYNEYILLMQLSDILGQQGNGGYINLACKQYNGSYPFAFKLLVDSSKQEILIDENDKHIHRALRAQEILTTI